MELYLLPFLAIAALAAQLSVGPPDFERDYQNYRAAAEAYKRCDDEAALAFVRNHDTAELRLLLAAVPDPNETAMRGGRVPWSSDTLAAAMLLHEKSFFLLAIGSLHELLSTPLASLMP